MPYNQTFKSTMKKLNSLFIIIVFMLFSFNCSAQYDPVTGLLKKEVNSRFLNLLDFPIAYYIQF